MCKDRRETRDASYVEIVKESNGFSWCECGGDGTRYHKDGSLKIKLKTRYDYLVRKRLPWCKDHQVHNAEEGENQYLQQQSA